MLNLLKVPHHTRKKIYCNCLAIYLLDYILKPLNKLLVYCIISCDTKLIICTAKHFHPSLSNCFWHETCDRTTNQSFVLVCFCSFLLFCFPWYLLLVVQELPVHKNLPTSIFTAGVWKPYHSHTVGWEFWFLKTKEGLSNHLIWSSSPFKAPAVWWRNGIP